MSRETGQNPLAILRRLCLGLDMSIKTKDTYVRYARRRVLDIPDLRLFSKQLKAIIYHATACGESLGESNLVDFSDLWSLSKCLEYLINNGQKFGENA